ncbi:RNA polymerase primary sigma factor [Hathewaya proteolytica DSM 3090]|uniref:RNA polymerase primary sigma factor n=1 Tax=Hathewaya proteolytica DSM 3090 TaxID=1121331 RepID=A0A1M6J1R9_9CLOT|nr:sigma-70 family RNA polymerase sigma factor [Hathewaya proteolytica]SHJ40645.1 RNA polymerase primary sigma factor [Hathewaya proteolytica DSM 3090]
MYQEMPASDFADCFQYNKHLPIGDKGIDLERFKQCSNEELSNFYKQGHKEVLEILIAKNKKLVYSRVLKYLHLYNNDLTMEDLMQNAYMGFMEAVERYDPSKNTKLSTYSVCWIDKEILKAIFDLGFSIRIPYHRFELIQKVWRAWTNNEKISNMDIKSMADEINVKSDKLNDAIYIMGNLINVTSLNNTINCEDNTEFMELIPEDCDKCPENMYDIKELRNVINYILSFLSKREQTVLKLRYGFENDKCETLENIGKKLGISKERVRQIENSALRKIRCCEDISMLNDFS